MERQLSQQSLGKAYREFSRQKYNKYRHQFPSMRESQVVVKIIRQWQKMSMDDKITLNERFSLAKRYEDEDIEKHLMSSNKKSEMTTQKDGSQKKHLESAVKIYPMKSQIKVVDDDSNFNRGSEKMQEQKYDKESSSYLLVKSKERDEELPLAKKAKNHQYIKFYRAEYERQIKQHPSWDSFKVSQIIKLCWASKLKQDKINRRLIKKKMIFKTRAIRKLSGKQFFRRMKEQKGYSLRDTIFRWRKLTFQGKLMFDLKGKGQNDYSSRPSLRKNAINLKIDQQTCELPNFMFKPII